MRIAHLALDNFRNYRSLEIDLGPGCSVFLGKNGQGKTNILEGTYFLATLASWRVGDESDLVMAGEAVARVGAEVVSAGDRNVRIDIELGGRQRAFRNGKLETRRREVTGEVRVTLFAPEDLEIVKGGPAARRAFIDNHIAQTRPTQAAIKSDFDRVLKQRNGLLRSAGGRPPAGGTLDVWDGQFVEKGAALAASRRAALVELMPGVVEVYTEASGASTSLAADYMSSYDEEGDGGESALLLALNEARREEIRRGVTLVGPQRDDIHISIDKQDTRTRASQGEQRTVALSLRLGEHRRLSEISGEPGILLLDDVFSELDPDRSELLVGRIAGTQALVTSAGLIPDEVAELAEARFDVSAGSITRAA